MAVAEGGSLIQHLPDVTKLDHRPAPAIINPSKLFTTCPPF